MIRDHALHLYFFCLPDIFGRDSIFDFDESKEYLIKQAFAVKGVGNRHWLWISDRYSVFTLCQGLYHRTIKTPFYTGSSNL